MNKKDVLTVTGKLYKIPVAQVNEAFKFTDTTPDDEQIEDSTALAFFETQQKAVIKNRYDAGFKVAEAQAKAKFEKDLKEVYKVVDEDPENPLTGLDLVKHVIDLQSKDDPKNPRQPKQLTDEEIKKTPVYLKLEADTKAEVKKITEKAAADVKTLQDAENYKTVLSDIEKEAIKYFQEIGEADLPADKVLADRYIKKLLLDELKQGRKFEKQKDGSFLILNEDGTRSEDSLGHPVLLKDLVTNISKEAFTFKKTAKRESPNNGDPAKKIDGKPNGDQQPKKYTGNAPKDAAAYVAIITDQTIEPEVRADAKTQYGEQFANG